MVAFVSRKYVTGSLHPAETPPRHYTCWKLRSIYRILPVVPMRTQGTWHNFLFFRHYLEGTLVAETTHLNSPNVQYSYALRKRSRCFLMLSEGNCATAGHVKVFFAIDVDWFSPTLFFSFFIKMTCIPFNSLAVTNGSYSTSRNNSSILPSSFLSQSLSFSWE